MWHACVHALVVQVILACLSTKRMLFYDMRHACMQELDEAQAQAQGLHTKLQREEDRVARYKHAADTARSAYESAQTPPPKLAGARGFELDR
jgi:hypothetical protein